MKDRQRNNILVILLVIAFFTGATIQFSEGEALVGVVMFLVALALTTRINIKGTYISKSSKFFVVLGIFIVLADVAYNLKAMNRLGTLDSMTFFLGVSFIAYGMKNAQYNRMGEFGIYMSGTFIILFQIFYSLLPSLNNNFINYFDHYFVLLPSLAIINAVSDISIQIIGIETVHFAGFEHASIVIGGPCSGLYSMFLLVGIIVGYARMERLRNKRSVSLLIVITIIVAYIANLIRVSTLYYIGYRYGLERMMLVHVHLGWIIFIMISIGLLRILNKVK